MGTSTNGLLWYGVAIDGSPDDGDETAEAIHALLYGDEDDEDDLYGDGREWLAEHDLTGVVEFVEHCSAEYPMYGIAVAGSVVTARRGYPVWVESLVDPDARPVADALRALGLSPEEATFGWHLASLWA